MEVTKKTLTRIVELKKLFFENDYQTQQFEKELSNIEKVLHEWPAASFAYTINEYEDGSISHDHTEIYLQTSPFKIVIRYWDYDKKWLIHAITRELTNVTNDTIKRIAEQFKKPQEIGVLTTKKIENWVDYQTNIYNDAKKENEKNADKVAEFLKSIEGEQVQWWGENKKGEIIKNGLKFSFEINPTYVSTRIEIYYQAGNDFETFKKLADNKFQGKQ